MFETVTSRIEELREDLPAAPARAASPGESTDSVFSPAPYFLLALGVGLFIGLALAARSARRP